MQLPLYQCFKQVRAAKIIGIEYGITTAALILDTEKERHTHVVAAAWMTKHKPEMGGYFVQYLDPASGMIDYESYSPAKPFEAGYARLELVQEQDGPGFRQGLAYDPVHDWAPSEAGVIAGIDSAALHAAIQCGTAFARRPAPADAMTGVDIDAAHRNPAFFPANPLKHKVG